MKPISTHKLQQRKNNTSRGVVERECMGTPFP